MLSVTPYWYSPVYKMKCIKYVLSVLKYYGSIVELA